MLYGSNAHLVIEHILRRAGTRQRGDVGPDGRKIALVMEGGGMRSVCSGAGATALAQLGFGDVFDEIYATSAAVMNASYFLAEQPLLGMSVYFENCTTSSFFNPFRLWKILNVDYIVDQVAAVEKRFDTDLLVRSPTRLLISACHAHTGELVLIDAKSTKTPLLQVFRAAMALPVLYNRTVYVDGHPCIDGGTVLPFPLNHVLERKCTDLLVLSTRPAGFVEPQPTRAMRCIFDFARGRRKWRLCRAFATRHHMSQRVRDIALGRIDPPPDVNVATICPDDDATIASMTTARATAHKAVVSYGRNTFSIFGRDGRSFSFPNYL